MTVSAVNNGTTAAEPLADATIEARKDRLWQAAQGIEEMFMSVLLNQINKGIDKDTLLHGGTGEEMFQKQLNAAYARRATAANSREIGRGIASMVYDQMLGRDPRLADATQRIGDARARLDAMKYANESSPTALRASFATTG